MENLNSLIHILHLKWVINNLIFYRMKKTFYILNIITS
nr:MAG TPA: hypothetical protein [Caudoviricetes sp.]